MRGEREKNRRTMKRGVIERERGKEKEKGGEEKMRGNDGRNQEW